MRRITRHLLLLITLLGSPAAALAQEGDVVDEIAAVVGDQILLRSEVDAVVAGVVRQQSIPFTADLWNSALQQMIDEKVLLNHARRDTTVIVADEQVNQMLDSRIQQMSLQLGGQARLEEAYGKSVVEIKDELREDFRDQLMADEFRRRKLLTIKITPSEVEEWFGRFPTDSLPTLPEMVRVAHVVRYPTVTDAARRESREILQAIRDSVVAGVSTLESMAELFSEDPGSARTGGRYESMSIRDLVPEFAAVASRLPLGEVSPIFETQFGLHILRVNSRRGDILDYNHILIRFDESKADPGPALDLLTAIRDSVVAQGVPFDAVAKRHSEEESSSLRGGRVTDPQTGERNLYIEGLGPYWQQTLIDLEVGEVSEPSETELLDGRRAFHIVKLQARTPSHRVDIATDYAFIEQYAQREKEARVLAEWLKSLRSGVYVDVRSVFNDSSTAQN